MAKIVMDTHMHSKASDGVFDPTQVVEHAKKVGLEYIALTDHDTVYGIAEAEARAKELDLTFLPGVEIDAQYEAVYNDRNVKVKNLELLGLNVDVKRISPWLERMLAERLQTFDEYCDAFNRYINAENFDARNVENNFVLQNVCPITFENVVDWKNKAIAYDNPQPALSKMDLVRYIVDTFVVPCELARNVQLGDRPAGEVFKDEYREILKSKKNRKPNFYEAIAAVKAAEGKAVIAHPGLTKAYKDGMVKEWELPENEWFTNDEFTPYVFLKDLADYGLDGIEQYYYAACDAPHAEAQDRINRYFARVADELGLFVTYGADCHGPKGAGPLMGQFGANEAQAQEVLRNLLS